MFAALITTSEVTALHLYGEARLLEELLGLGAGDDAVRAGLHPPELRHVVAQLLPRDLPDAAPIRAQYPGSRQPIRGQYSLTWPRPRPRHHSCPGRCSPPLCPATARRTSHTSSKALQMESSRPGEIPKQMIPMGMWVPENMKIKNI